MLTKVGSIKALNTVYVVQKMIFYWILPYKLSNVVQLKLRPTLRRALWEMYFLFPIFSLCDKGSDDTESESDERINVMFLRETPGRLVLKRQT